MSKFRCRASGKLLLFGEYLVLKGSQCLAIPLSVGQSLLVSRGPENGILWRCFEFEVCWLEIYFSATLDIIRTTDEEKAKRIQNLLLFIRKSRSEIPMSALSFKFNLNFCRQFGLGTSSTLISLLSQWSGIDPYLLLRESFGGSGYDIAASTANQPFLYSIEKKKIKDIRLPKAITDNLLFVYTGKKQNSSVEVSRFNKHRTSNAQIEQMNKIVKQAAQSSQIEGWEHLIAESESLLSDITGQKPVQETYFSDYRYSVKSLGAWGGDFVMATCRDTTIARKYFETKHKSPVFTYKELIK